MKPRYASVDEQVEFGLDEISEDRTVTIPLKDLLYVYKTLGELNRFFHQPLHYPTLRAVEDFMGSVERGAYHLIQESYYAKLRDVFPPDIAKGLDEGHLYPDVPPDYYDENPGK